jgi:uncharacterized protein (TIGR02594 family)
MRTVKIVLKMVIVLLFLCFMVMSAEKAIAEEATIEDVGIDVIESISFPDSYIFTGAAQNKIPIIVPPGRGGIAPNLAIRYYSYRHNGWVGLGWDLDLGVIQRATKHGVDYSVDDYVFVKDINRTELLARSDWGAGYYGAKIEGEFAKFFLNPSTGGWEVTARDGTTYFYGTTGDSRQDNEHGVFQWCLDRVEDPHGNYMTVTYIKDQGEIYPDRIDYTGHTGGLSPTNYVQFYLEGRSDAPVMYTSNAAVKTAKRLKSIDIVADGDRARAYQLTYTGSEATARSLLASVQQYGSDATIDGDGAITGGTALPAIACNYTAEAEAFGSPDTPWGVGIGLNGDKGCSLGDLNGDGKADFLYPYKSLPGSEYYKKLQVQLSTGDGFGPDTLWGQTANDITVWASDDLNGDGKADFLYTIGSDITLYLRVLLSTGDGFGPDTLWGVTTNAIGSWDITHANGFALGDLNGDGKADFFYNSSRSLRVLLSSGAGFSPDTQWGMTSSAIAAWALADLNGDGKEDFLYQPDEYDYSLRVLLSTGDGFGPETQWGETVYGIAGINGFSPTGDKFFYSFYGGFRGFPYIATWIMADFNGDGKEDFLYSPMGGSSSYSFRVMLSTGDGFAPETQWGVNPTVTQDDWGNYYVDDFSFADFNGDGKTDFFYQPAHPVPTTKLQVMLSTGDGFGPDTQWGATVITGNVPIWKLADCTGDGKADFVYGFGAIARVVASDPDKTMLLSAFANGFGAVSNIEYTPSSAYENTLLPFVLQTASRITVDVNDDFNNQSDRTFTYGGGYYNVLEREFRGFEHAVVTDQVTGLVTETHFHQDEVFKGEIAWAETRDSTGAAVERIDNDWEAADYGDGRFFPYIAQGIVTKYDDAGASLGTTTTAYTYDDDYGSVLTETKTTSDGYSRFIETQYLNDTTNWIIGKPTNIKVRQSAGSAILRETRMQYTADSRRLLEYEKRVHDGAEYTTAYEYDSYGNVTRKTGPRGYWTHTVYEDDTYTFPHIITSLVTQDPAEPETHQVEKTFDPRFGAVLTETDVNDQVTTYQYDVFGRQTYVDYPDPSWKQTTYHIETGNHHVVVQASDAPETTVFLDNIGRRIEKQLEAGGTTIVTATQYDSAGRVSAESLPFFAGGTAEYKIYEYDIRSRLWKQTNPDGTYKEIHYNGLQETVYDENGHSKTSTKDLLTRITRVDEPTGGYAAYTYDIFDNLVGVRDPIDNQTTITYDDLGRKVSMDDPYQGYWEYAYDEADNLTWQKNGRGQEVDLQYDGLNRVLQKAYHTTGRQVVYTYDEVRSGYFNKGSLTTVTVTSETPQIATEYNYDKMGRGVFETRAIEGTSYDFSRTYDLAGRLLSVTYPGGTLVEYAYHPIGNLKEVIMNGSATLADYTNYNAMSQVGQADYGNDTSTSYTYHAHNYRLHTLTTSDSASQTIQDLSYGYDNVGNVMSITDSLNSVTQTFVYDEVDRLTHAQASTGDPARQYNLTYTYDLGGNMLAKTDNNGSGMGWQVVDQDALGRPTSIDYDTAIADIGERHVDYNQDNMPTRIVFKGNETNLVYDGENVRIKKVSASSTVIYVGGLYEIRDGAPVIHIFAGAQRIVSIEGTDTHYYHTDHLNSTTVMTDVNGSRVEEMGYLPFGGLLYHNVFQGGQWSTVFRFTGQEYDAEYALYNYNARLYDPIMGRFISADPIIQDAYNPQNLNRYIYCLNNPLIYVDPTGNESGEGWSYGSYTGSISYGGWGGYSGLGASFSDWAASKTSGTNWDGSDGSEGSGASNTTETAVISDISFVLWAENIGEAIGQAIDLSYMWCLLSQLGVEEMSGYDINRGEIMSYHKTTSEYDHTWTDEKAWCSSILNWVMEQSGIEGTHSARALSWLDWGRELSEPTKGCIAVMNYGRGKGHVGVVVGVTENGFIAVLGGNQHNSVNVSVFSHDDYNDITYVYPSNLSRTYSLPVISGSSGRGR